MHSITTQSRHLFGLFARWIGTASLVSLLVATLEIYKAKGNFTSAHKAAFNVLTITLNVALGLNFFEAFKELAHVLRGKVQTWGVTKEEKNLIPRIENLLVVFRLFKISWRRSGIKALAIFCAAWLSINLIAQVANAITSLTYNVSDGVDYHGIYTSSDLVNVSNHTCYQGLYSLADGCPSRVTAHQVAHLYGEMNLGTEEGPYDDLSDVLNSRHLYRYYHRSSRNRQQYAYRFNEYNPGDSQRVYPFLTERIITVEALNCIKYNQTTADNKDPQTFTYENVANETDRGNITIPRLYLGNDGTTYIYRGYHDPPDATIYSCGDRCILMWAYQNPGIQPKGIFYQCPVNISDVKNTQRPEHNTPNDVAKVAAASIALQGRFTGDIENYSGKNFEQYQFYATGSPLDIHGKEANQVGEQFAAFTLGSLATMVSKNPQIQIPGHLPHLGHSLTLYEPYLAILMAFIVAMHLVTFIATIYWARDAGYSGTFDVGLGNLGAQPNDSQQHLAQGHEVHSADAHVFEEHSADSGQDAAHA